MSFYYWDQMRVATVGTKEQPFLENSRVPRYPQNEEWVPKNNPTFFLSFLFFIFYYYYYFWWWGCGFRISNFSYFQSILIKICLAI